jgi:hypothetical protein
MADLSLLSAALLTFGVDPSYIGIFIEGHAEYPTNEDLPDGFAERIEILRSAVRAGELETLKISHDKNEEIDVNNTTIKTSEFRNWCEANGFNHNLPGYKAAQTSKWPWGNYETELLCSLAVAAEEYWSEYKPEDPTTAPTNEEVVDWLVDNQKISKRTAEVMATILRADNLHPGPRKNPRTHK